MEVEHALVVDGAEEDFSMEAVEPEVRLKGEGLSERDESVAETGRGGLLSAGREDTFWSFFWSVVRPFSFPLGR
jgi:hypothetical protein